MVHKVRRLALDIEVLGDRQFPHEVEARGRRDPIQALARVARFPKLQRVTFLQRPPGDTFPGCNFSWKMLDMEPHKISAWARVRFLDLVSRLRRHWAASSGGVPAKWEWLINQHDVALNMEWFWVNNGLGPVIPARRDETQSFIPPLPSAMPS